MRASITISHPPTPAASRARARGVRAGDPYAQVRRSAGPVPTPCGELRRCPMYELSSYTRLVILEYIFEKGCRVIGLDALASLSPASDSRAGEVLRLRREISRMQRRRSEHTLLPLDPAFSASSPRRACRPAPPTPSPPRRARARTAQRRIAEGALVRRRRHADTRRRSGGRIRHRSRPSDPRPPTRENAGSRRPPRWPSRTPDRRASRHTGAGCRRLPPERSPARSRMHAPGHRDARHRTVAAERGDDTPAGPALARPRRRLGLLSDCTVTVTAQTRHTSRPSSVQVRLPGGHGAVETSRGPSSPRCPRSRPRSSGRGDSAPPELLRWAEAG